MTPEAVIYRYLELLTPEAREHERLCALIGSDADLLNNWLKIFDLPASWGAFEQALKGLKDSEFASIAAAQAHAVTPSAGSARLSLDQWIAVLRAVEIGAELITEVAVPDRIQSESESEDIRLRLLLALSGVQLEGDAALSQLNDFRGSNPSLLEDASLELRVFCVLEGIELNRDHELATALLGLDSDSYQFVVERAETRLTERISALELDVEDDTDWQHRIWLRQQLAIASRAFADCDSLLEIEPLHDQVSRSVFKKPPLILLKSAGDYFAHDPSQIRIRAASRSSAVARSVHEHRAVTIVEAQNTAVVDRQLLRLLSCDAAIAYADDDGDFVLIADLDEDFDTEVALSLYVQALAPHLKRVQSADEPEPDLGDSAGPSVEQIEVFRAAEGQRLRELVHEANNPLSIVRNYLHILELKLQDEEETADQIRLIAAEVKRASDIFARARDIPVFEPEDEAVAEHAEEQLDLVAWLRGVVELNRGLAEERAVGLRAQFPDAQVELSVAREPLAQILMNLIKNALEACSHGDQVKVSLDPTVYRDGAAGLEILIEDTGPGLTAEVLQNLAEDKESTKGGEGVGLKVTYRLAREMGVGLDVRTSSRGTIFTLFVNRDGHPTPTIAGDLES